MACPIYNTDIKFLHYMHGQPEHNTRPHARLHPSFLPTERSFDLQATWINDVLGLFFDVIHRCLYNRALPDVRSTGTGIKFCTVCQCAYISEMRKTRPTVQLRFVILLPADENTIFVYHCQPCNSSERRK